MKALKLLFIIVVLSLSGCDDEPEGPQMGCLTGVVKGGTSRVLIRCCTKEEYLAGGNVNAGGTSNWSNYESHQWVKVDKCGDC